MRYAIAMPALSALFWTLAEISMIADGRAPTYSQNMASVGLLLLWAAIGAYLDGTKK